MIKKIVITGDCQRPVPPQYFNIEWLFDLIKYQVQEVTGVSPTMLACGEQLSVENWLKTYVSGHQESWHSKHEMMLARDETLVIGFEMPLSAKESFDHEGIQYINLIIHPIRYMDDLMIGVKCGGRWPKTEYLASIAVGEGNFFVQANLVRAQMRKLPGLPVKPDTRLIVGQTEVDRSVVRNGKVLTLLDFRSNVEKLFEDKRPVLFKPHPSNAYGRALGLVLDLGAQVTTDNLYRLFAHKEIAVVAGISSSCLYEARYFGKKVEFFGDDWTRGYSPIMAEDFLSLQFWSRLLGEVMTTKAGGNLRFVGGRSRLRRSCQSWWGFDYVENGQK